MSAELLVNVAPFETRIARIENGQAEEIYIEREHERGLKGNIYRGRVQRVLPGIQAAFIDMGLERAGFLYVGDIMQATGGEAAAMLEGSAGDGGDGESEGRERNNQPRRTLPPIDTLLREGQEIVVQVSKEPISSKGPRATTLLSLAGRYLVYLPHIEHVGIARRLEEPTERKRLLEIGQKLKPAKGGLIIRTVAEGHSEEDLAQDLELLLKMWEEIERKSRPAKQAERLIHMELNLYLRAMRDFVDNDVEKIHVDSREAYENMKRFAKRFMPDVARRLYYYPGERPIFDVYGVEEEINKALRRKVPLKSGGHIVIDQTEALVAIDVNSGSFVGSRSMEETGFKTNLEAVHEIVHQLRLRNLGGIIVVDFIDMMEEENKTRLMEVLAEALKRDKTKTFVVQLSPLGLVEMTRKRTRESLGRTLQEECGCCSATGQVKSPTTLCYQIFRELVAEARAYPCDKLTVIANPQIIDLMLGDEADNVARLERFLKKEIVLTSDAGLGRDQYEVALL